jgi:hypothetical protein
MQGPLPWTALLQGGPWSERFAVEVVEVVIELCASVIQVSVAAVFKSALRFLRKPEPEKEMSVENACE